MNSLVLTNIGWSLALLVAFWGIGNPITTKIKAPGWTAAPIGLAVFILIAGWLDYTHNANRQVLTLLALAGLAAGLLQFKTAIAGIKSVGKSTAWLALIPALLIGWIGAQHNIVGANWDDSAGYVPVCHELAVSGNSWAPFSLRRAIAWGGQYPLQTLGMLFTADYGAYVYDRCLANWMWVIMTIAIAKNASKGRGAAIALILPFLPHTNVNSAPHATLAILLATAWVIRKNPIVFATAAAAMMALRLQAVPMVGIMVLWTLWEMYREKAKAKEILAWCGKSAPVVILGLVPFILNHIRLFHTPLPMVWPGTIHPDHLSWVTTTPARVMNFRAAILGNVMIFSVLAWACVRENGKMAATALIAYTYIVWATPEYSPGEWARYTWPLLAAAFACTLLAQPKEKWLAAMVLISMGAPSMNHIHQVFSEKLVIPSPDYEEIPEAWKADPKKKDRTLIIRSKVLEAQELIPEGVAITTAISKPSLLNFSRNKIFNLDEMGAVGSPPTTGKIEDWKAWAKPHGIEFLIFEDPDGWIGEAHLKSTYLERKGPADLPHYRRVWNPIRSAMLTGLEKLKENYGGKPIHGFHVVDLR